MIGRDGVGRRREDAEIREIDLMHRAQRTDRGPDRHEHVSRSEPNDLSS